jgi:membrane-associated phospholipid phosphatase
MATTTLKLILVIIFITFYCTAQPIQSTSPDSVAGSHSHVNWTIIGIAGAATVTTIMFHYDQQIYDGLYRWKMNNKIVKNVSPVITDLGDGTFSAGLFGGFAGYGLIFKDKKAFEVGKIGIESFLFTGIAVQIFKNLCGRERPSAATRAGGFWHGPFSYLREPKNGRGISSFDAFPSGHTATVFAAATTISDFYTEPWVLYTCYSLATITAISRVTESTHWISDCFVGAIIGYYGTKLVEKLNYGSDGIALLPQADGHQYGLLLSVNF